MALSVTPAVALKVSSSYGPEPIGLMSVKVAGSPDSTPQTAWGTMYTEPATYCRFVYSDAENETVTSFPDAVAPVTGMPLVLVSGYLTSML